VLQCVADCVAASLSRTQRAYHLELSENKIEGMCARERESVLWCIARCVAASLSQTQCARDLELSGNVCKAYVCVCVCECAAIAECVAARKYTINSVR